LSNQLIYQKIILYPIRTMIRTMKNFAEFNYWTDVAAIFHKLKQKQKKWQSNA